MSAVLGAVCTYRRPGELRATLDAIDAQTRRPDRLVVIDNDADPAIAELVAAHPIGRSLPVETIGARDNPGPAGAFALAFDQLCAVADDDDIMVIFDDDDPLPSTTVLADLIGIAEASFGNPAVGGVGLRGGALNHRTGIVNRRPSTTQGETEGADHLHGGWFPCYRFSALRMVGQFDPSFFWGFEELDLGRRLIAMGYELRVTPELYSSVAPNRPSARSPFSLPDRSWRHFYRHRNLLRILRRDDAWGAVALTISLRLVAKPLLCAFVRPRLAGWHLRTNLRAIVDGLRPTTPAPKNRHHLPG